jgi:hypothetical protein
VYRLSSLYDRRYTRARRPAEPFQLLFFRGCTAFDRDEAVPIAQDQ